jgi:hypothetical protein
MRGASYRKHSKGRKSRRRRNDDSDESYGTLTEDELFSDVMSEADIDDPTIEMREDDQDTDALPFNFDDQMRLH